MKLADLIRIARIRVDDNARPYLRSDELFTIDANEAESQACRRARIIVDSTSPMCVLAFNAGDITVDLDPKVIRIRRVRWVRADGSSRILRKKHRDDLDREDPSWEDVTGDPSHFVVGMDTNMLRPYPSPADGGSAYLTVVREPLEEMSKEGDEPEIAPRYHIALVHWMVHRYFGTLDSEARSDDKAKLAEEAFAMEFGPASTAQNEVWAELQEGFDPDDGSY